MSRAWLTLLTNPKYLPGLLVLNHSLVKVSSRYPLVVMIVASLPSECQKVLDEAHLQTILVNLLEPHHKVTFDPHDIRFNETWTKLCAFSVYQFKRVVLIDSDMLVIRNMDDLFDMDIAADHIAAVHACTCNPLKLAHYPSTWIPENCAHTYARGRTPVTINLQSPPTFQSLNSGLVVLTPNEETYEAITKLLATDPIVDTFRFPDQDLLAYFFRGRFIPLGYVYNALKTLRVCHRALWRDDEIHNVHYIISPKPWQDRNYGKTPDEVLLHSWWWREWDDMLPEWRKSTAFKTAVLPHVVCVS